MTHNIYGDDANNDDSNTCIDFIVPLELMDHWQRCSMISNFLASTHALGFGKLETKTADIFSVVINELLENAVKFSRDRSKLIMLSLKQRKNDVCIEAINTTDAVQAQRLSKLVEKLQTQTPETLYIEQLESISNIEDSNSSGLGLIMLLHDYHANLGVKIAPRIDNVAYYDVSISVSLDYRVIEAA